MEKYENLLEKYGINPTSSRLIILKAIISQKDTFSLISLENIVETIDKSTIFRVLSLFSKRDLFTRLMMAQALVNTVSAHAEMQTNTKHTYISHALNAIKPSASRILPYRK